jgi:hypothetical protein
MIRARWHLMRVAATGLRWLSLPFLLVGFIAVPILAAAAACEERARDLDPRLWDYAQHTDLHPPPGA